MYIENVVIGKPVAEVAEIFAFNENDWNINEKHKTHYTTERFLPKLLVECGLVKSTSEVIRNKPEYKRMLDDICFIEIKWGKRKLFILVGDNI